MALMEELQHLKVQLEDIKLATDNFDVNRVIGIGGFGKVYKGEVKHSKGKSMVALKRLDRKYGQGDREFLKEIMVLSRYTHENLISLLGFSNEGDEKILVYEYASRGSLDLHLNDATLTWRQRLRICLGAAKGLSYLHDPTYTTQQRVIHLDIKSSNILLDEHWNAKLSDFGLSKIGPANQPYTFLVTNAVGTPGYCDPVYMETYILTKESDVYSFGVVLFEVLCGRLCFEYNTNRLKVFVSTWKERYNENKLDEIVFEALKQQMDSSSLKSFSDIAYQCLKKSREERPKMSRVLEALKSALEYQEIYEGNKQSRNYEGIINNVVPPFNSQGELGSTPTEFLLSGAQTGGNIQPWFGKGEVNEDDPASVEGSTMIFNKVREEKERGTKQELPIDADRANEDLAANTPSTHPYEDEQYPRESLAAYRRAADAAARIQAAFRERSLKLRTKEVKDTNIEGEARCIIAAMRIQHAFRNHESRKQMAAAAHIQYRFRSWK